MFGFRVWGSCFGGLGFRFVGFRVWGLRFTEFERLGVLDFFSDLRVEGYSKGSALLQGRKAWGIRFPGLPDTGTIGIPR